jgi:hypothetical protein
MYYPNIESFLCDYLEGFKKETKPSKKAIMKMIFLPMRHFRDAEALSFPVKMINNVGMTPNSFNRLNNKYKLYEVDDYYNEGETRKLYPTPKLTLLMVAYLHSKHRAPCVKIKEVRGNVRESTRFDFSPFLNIGGLNIEGVIPINRGGLLEAVGNGMEDKTHLFSALRILALTDVEGLELGMFPHAFQQSETVGRIMGVGTSIQNTPRPIRKVVMSDYNDYDFVNCHYAIAAKHIEGGAISEYAVNSKYIRQSLANELEVEPSQIKLALLAILNGANNSHNNSIAGFVGNDKVKALFNMPLVKSIKEEASELSRAVPFDKLAIYLMNEEAKVLKACVGSNTISVPMHDGFMTRNEIDVDSAQKDIKALTGYDITITKKHERKAH